MSILIFFAGAFAIGGLLAYLEHRAFKRQFQRGYDTAVVDCQIKRAQADRARREHNGKWKKKGVKA